MPNNTSASEPTKGAARKIGPEFQVNTYTHSQQINPAIARIGDGGFIIAWQSFAQTSDTYDIFGQRYDANGSPVGPEMQINPARLIQNEYPALASLTDGGLLIAWGSRGSSQSNWNIQGRLYTSGGVPAGAEVQLITSATSNRIRPNIAMFPDGGVIVTWLSFDQVDPGYELFGQLFDADLKPAGKPFQINQQSEKLGLFETPAVAALSDGSFVVSWAAFQKTDDLAVFGQRYDRSGTAIRPVFQVDTKPFNISRHEPRIATLTSGEFIIAFSSKDPGGANIIAQRYDAAGAVAGDEFQVNTNTFAGKDRPALTALNDGGFVVTWDSEDQDGDDKGVFGQCYDAECHRVGGEFQVNTYTRGAQFLSDTATLSDGRFVITWISAEQDGSGHGIFGQIFQLG